MIFHIWSKYFLNNYINKNIRHLSKLFCTWLYRFYLTSFILMRKCENVLIITTAFYHILLSHCKYLLPLTRYRPLRIAVTAYLAPIKYFIRSAGILIIHYKR